MASGGFVSFRFACLLISATLPWSAAFSRTPSVEMDVIQTLERGGINWSAGVVFARGQGFAPADVTGPRGVAMAERAAVVDAYRNLLEVVGEVRVDSTTVVRDMMVESDVVRSRISGIVRGASTRVMSSANGEVEVRAEMPIDGALVSVVLDEPPGAVEARGRATPGMPVATLARVLHWMIPAARAATDPAAPDFACRAVAEPPFTGLLVDARHLPDFRIAISPRLRLDSGREVYPGDLIVRQRRPVSYDWTLQTACMRPLVTDRPIVIRAKATHEGLRSDLLIDAADWQRVSGDGELLSQARVIVLVAR